MAELRPSRMPQGEFAEMLRKNGFPACSKAAVSLAERPKETGVQFTPEARKTAQRLLNSPRRPEKRANPNKTTVWFDDETRAWLETRAYMEDTSVGELIRRIIGEARTKDTDSSAAPQNDNEKAASAVGATETAGCTEMGGQAMLVPTGHLHDTTKQEGNQG